MGGTRAASLIVYRGGRTHESLCPERQALYFARGPGPPVLQCGWDETITTDTGRVAGGWGPCGRWLAGFGKGRVGAHAACL